MRPSTPPASSVLTVTTGTVANANSDGSFYYSVVGGTQGETKLDDLSRNDFEKGNTDTFSGLEAAGGKPIKIRAAGSDGWQLAGMTIDGVPVDLSSCLGGKVWLDNPCESDYHYYDVACTSELTIDTATMTTNCPAPSPSRALCVGGRRRRPPDTLACVSTVYS